jgi:DNA mismatch repair protein MutL
MPIKILPDDLINKIAAGEVVERPASVVKELVENSIDAGASRIKVEIQGAGKKLIRVSDNGSGLTEEEINLALQRHSTSKISTLEDLFNLHSLGFRGEALPAIASVSNLKLEPNPSGSGLTVEVVELFYNVPARKKFLKSDATELGHIGDVVAKYTLAYPGIAFELIVDGKPLLKSGGSGNLKEAVMSVYGAEVLKSLVEVKSVFSWGKISGLVSRPIVTRIDKNYEVFYVNGRSVRNFLLNRALEEAYRTLIPGQRYPVGLLFIEIDPKLFDVNVHPTKREVKFLKTNEVMEAIRSSVKQALQESGSQFEGVAASLDAGNRAIEIGSGDQLPMTGFDAGLRAQSPSSGLTPLYQLALTYIVATDGLELVIIDQHAAQERILYDQLCCQSSVSCRQSLLTPETAELGIKETIILQENLEELKKAGFELEEFGGSAYLIRAVPAVAIKAPIKTLLLDLIAELSELGKAVQPEVKRENLFKIIACRSAVKAGDKLSFEEMKQLINDLLATQNPATCPHGRPTLINITEAELKKRFARS